MDKLLLVGVLSFVLIFAACTGPIDAPQQEQQPPQQEINPQSQPPAGDTQQYQCPDGSIVDDPAQCPDF